MDKELDHHTRELEKLAFGRVFGGEAITGKSNDELRLIVYNIHRHMSDMQ